MMITIIMAGQHNSSNIASWVMLHYANQPQICEQLYQGHIDQLAGGTGSLPGLTLRGLEKLQLHSSVVKKTLRMHNAIHSIMRLVKRPLPVPNTSWTIHLGHAVFASPGVSANSEEYFHDPATWDPRRWDDRAIGEDDESGMVDHGYGRSSRGTESAYLPFGGGRYRFIGERFAYLNLGSSRRSWCATFASRMSVEGMECRHRITAPCFRGRWSQRMFVGRSDSLEEVVGLLWLHVSCSCRVSDNAYFLLPGLCSVYSVI